MDLNYCKHFLNNLIDQSPELVKKEVVKLLKSIENYLDEESKYEDMQTMLRRVIPQYENRFSYLVEDFHVLKEITLQQKIEMVLEILSYLSVLVTQLTKILNSDIVSRIKNDSFYKDKSSLYEKLGNFKSERIAWISILKSLNLMLENKLVENKIKLSKENE